MHFIRHLYKVKLTRKLMESNHATLFIIEQMSTFLTYLMTKINLQKNQHRYASLFVIIAHITRVVVSRCISSK